MPRVTVVIATYNRPELLKRTLQSVLNQTVDDWVLLVIGDCCDPETEEAINTFEDDRIFYINLEERCGEQGGPNTAGMFAAKTDYVAFVNHDDIWLPDHLETALATLAERNAEFFISATAITATVIDGNTDEYRLAFRYISPKGRSVEAGFDKSPVYFEPVSSWVVHNSLLKRVGAWKPAAQLFRTPLEDWILRAWRAGVKMVFSDVITTIYCNGNRNPNIGGDPSYAAGASEQTHWLEELARLGADGLRAQMYDNASRFEDKTRIFVHTRANSEDYRVFKKLQNRETADLYKEFGWDGFEAACRMLKYSPGFRLRRMLKRRTGETLEPHTDWRKVSRAVKAALEADDRWKKIFPS